MTGPGAVAGLAALASPGLATGVLAGVAACGAGLIGMLPLGRRGDQDAAAGHDPGSVSSRAEVARGEGVARPDGPADASSPLPTEVDAAAGDRGGTTGATPAKANSPSLWADLKAGLNAVRHTPALRDITAATCVAFLGMGGLTVAAVLLAGERGHPDGGGLLVTAFAVGALGGCLALAHREPRISPRRLALASLIGTGAALTGAALVPSYTIAVMLFIAAGVCDGPLLTSTLRIRADHAPDSVRTQVFTLGAGLKISAAACGAALTGIAADSELPPWILLLTIAALQLAGATFLRDHTQDPSSRPARSLSPTTPSEG